MNIETAFDKAKLVNFTESFSTPKSKDSKQTVTTTVWNTNKIGGWELYKEKTTEINVFKDVIEENMISKIISKLDKVMNKINFKAFGKVKSKKVIVVDKNEDLDLEDLAREKRKDVCKKLESVEKIKSSKGKLLQEKNC